MAQKDLKDKVRARLAAIEKANGGLVTPDAVSKIDMMMKFSSRAIRSVSATRLRKIQDGSRFVPVARYGSAMIPLENEVGLLMNGPRLVIGQIQKLEDDA